MDGSVVMVIRCDIEENTKSLSAVDIFLICGYPTNRTQPLYEMEPSRSVLLITCCCPVQCVDEDDAVLIKYGFHTHVNTRMLYDEE